MLHFDLSPSTGRYVPQSDSAKGSESIRVFGLDRELLEAARSDAWVLLQAIVVAYGDATERYDQQQADVLCGPRPPRVTRAGLGVPRAI
jgi:hypothetical protein